MGIIGSLYRDVRAIVGIACLPLTGGGINPVDIGKLPGAFRDLSIHAAIKGLGVVERWASHDDEPDSEELRRSWLELQRTLQQRISATLTPPQ